MDNEKENQKHAAESVSVSQDTSMFNGSFLSLPTKIHHIIFDSIDTRTLIQSVPYVCKILYECVKNYSRLKMDCTSSSEFEIKIASRIIHPANITSLTVSNKLNESCSFDTFVTIFNIHRFTGLRSLALREVGSLERFLPLLDNNNNNLFSLSIEFCQRPCNRSLEILSNVITCSNLKYLELNNTDNVIEDIAWPSQCRLTRLHIDICTYTGYLLVLRQMPSLKTVSLQDFIMNDQSGTISTSLSSELLSLSIHGCTLPIEDLYSILSLTPALTYLKVISFIRSFTLFNGSAWEQFILSKLIHLNKFEFLFSRNQPYDTDHTSSMKSIIASFQTPFWLEDKHWFVTCDFLLRMPEKLRIYTTPICTTNFEDSMRFEVSSRNSVWRFTERSPAVAIDVNEDEKILKLDFSNGTLGKIGLTSVANVLVHNQIIYILNLGSQLIGEESIQILANALENNQTLSILRLGGNRINKNALKYLADALRNNKTLVELSLGYNEIEGDDVQYIADALQVNKTLTSLSLVGNHIAVLGAQHLAEALHINNVLTELYLDGNQIGDEGTQHLAHTLQTNQTLATLSLTGNQIGIPGVQHLADALRVNTSLTTLYLVGNRFGMVGATSLVDALQNNKSLTTLATEYNQISDQMTRHINELLKQNAQITMKD